MGNHTAATFLRWLVAAVVLVFFLACSAYVALITGFSTEPQGPHRITRNWHILIIAVVAGMLGIISSRAILRRRILSWSLVLALPIPALIALDQAGWI